MKKNKSELNENNFYDLCKYFIDTVNEEFQYLETDYKFSVISGQYDFKDNCLVKLNNPLKAWFDINVEYILNDFHLIISFGDREFIIESKFIKGDEKFGIWEFLKILNIDYNRISGESFINLISAKIQPEVRHVLA